VRKVVLDGQQAAVEPRAGKGLVQQFGDALAGAAIAHPIQDQPWIGSKAEAESLEQKLKALGYNTEALYWTPQPPKK